MPIRSRTIPLLLVPTLLLAAVLAAGCGQTKVIDGQKIETQLQEKLRSPERDITSAECPGDVKIEAGATFTCTLAVAGGKTEVVTLKILDDEGNVEPTDVSPAK